MFGVGVCLIRRWGRGTLLSCMFLFLRCIVVRGLAVSWSVSCWRILRGFMGVRRRLRSMTFLVRGFMLRFLTGWSCFVSVVFVRVIRRSVVIVGLGRICRLILWRI